MVLPARTSGLFLTSAQLSLAPWCSLSLLPGSARLVLHEVLVVYWLSLTHACSSPAYMPCLLLLPSTRTFVSLLPSSWPLLLRRLSYLGCPILPILHGVPAVYQPCAASATPLRSRYTYPALCFNAPPLAAARNRILPITPAHPTHTCPTIPRTHLLAHRARLTPFCSPFSFGMQLRFVPVSFTLAHHLRQLAPTAARPLWRGPQRRPDARTLTASLTPPCSVCPSAASPDLPPRAFWSTCPLVRGFRPASRLL